MICIIANTIQIYPCKSRTQRCLSLVQYTQQLVILHNQLLASGGGGGGIPNRVISYSLAPKDYLKEIHSYDTGQHILQNLTWSPQNELLFASSDCDVVIFKHDCQNFLKKVSTFKADFHSGRDASLNFIKISPKGLILAAGGDEGILRLFAIQKKGQCRVIQKFQEKKGPLLSSQFNDIEGLIIFNTNKLLFIYDLSRLQKLATIKVSPHLLISLGVFSKVRSEILIVVHEKKGGCFIETRNFRTGKVINQSSYILSTMASSYCWAGKENLLLGSCEGQITAYDCYFHSRRFYDSGHDEMIVKGLAVKPAQNSKGYIIHSGSPSMVIQTRLFQKKEGSGSVFWDCISLICLILFSFLGVLLAYEQRPTPPIYY